MLTLGFTGDVKSTACTTHPPPLADCLAHDTTSPYIVFSQLKLHEKSLMWDGIK